jgi:hypothetical protein
MKRQVFSKYQSQLMIFFIAALAMFMTYHAANAEVKPTPFSTQIAQVNAANQGTFSQQSQSISKGQISNSTSTKRQSLLAPVSLTYYHQFLGPTLNGYSGQTYNVFQEAIDSPGSGKAPYQSFHGLNLRYEINSDWAIGTTMSAINSYTDNVESKDKNGNTIINNNNTQIFNARFYTTIPSLKTRSFSLFSTLAFEAPTSSISKENEMRYGLVLQNSLIINLPSFHWSTGIMTQVYRMYYKNNYLQPNCSSCSPTTYQTLIVSGAPFINYRFSDKWLWSNSVTFDWDQRGIQTGSREFNNNLSDRVRTTLSYFPQKIKYLQSVGIFSQALIDYKNETTAFGADFSVRF